MRSIMILVRYITWIQGWLSRCSRGVKPPLPPSSTIRVEENRTYSDWWSKGAILCRMNKLRIHSSFLMYNEWCALRKRMEIQRRSSSYSMMRTITMKMSSLCGRKAGRKRKKVKRLEICGNLILIFFLSSTWPRPTRWAHKLELRLQCRYTLR